MKSSKSFAPRTLKRNFGWNFAGNTIYNLAQWLMLVGLARIGGATALGQFAFMVAVAAPVFLLFGLNLRTAQVTDAKRELTLPNVFYLRNRLNVAASAVALGILFFSGFRGELLLASAIFCVAKSVETHSQSYYGYYQIHERLDIMSKSLMMRAIFGPTLFVAGFYLGGGLVWACAGLVFGWMVPQLLFDRVQMRHMTNLEGIQFSGKVHISSDVVRRLFLRALPLGIDQGISSLAIMAPRYVVQFALGAALMGRYVALAYLAQVITTITAALGGAVQPRMVKAYHRHDHREFLKLTYALTAFGLCISFVLLVGAWLFGAFFIELAFGKTFVNQPLLLILMIGAGAITTNRCLSKAVEVTQRFKSYLAADFIIMGIIALTAPWLVGQYGIVGAALATIIGFSFGVLTMAWIIWRALLNHNETDPHPADGDLPSPTLM